MPAGPGFDEKARRMEEARSAWTGPGTVQPDRSDADSLKHIIRDLGNQSPGTVDHFAKVVYDVVNRSFLDPQKENFLQELASAIAGLKWHGSDGFGGDDEPNAKGAAEFKTMMATIIIDAMVEYVLASAWPQAKVDAPQGQSEAEDVINELATPEATRVQNILAALVRLQVERGGERVDSIEKESVFLLNQLMDYKDGKINAIGVLTSIIDKLQSYGYYEGSKSVSTNESFEQNAVKMLRIFRVFAYPEENISFRRFAFLNLLNVVTYENDLMALDVKLSRDPTLLLDRATVESLRTLIGNYDRALSEYQQALKYERAGCKDGLESRILVESISARMYRGMDDNPYNLKVVGSQRKHWNYDEVTLTYQQTDNIRDWLSKDPLTKITQSSSERRILRNAKPLFESGRARNYGNWTRLDKIARVVFGFIGIVSLIAPLFALSYIKPKGYRLMTTALFVGIFTTVFSIISTASNQELIAVSAAYAAVLVVFVGTTS